jgi:hypothetical protein
MCSFPTATTTHHHKLVLQTTQMHYFTVLEVRSPSGLGSAWGITGLLFLLRAPGRALLPIAFLLAEFCPQILNVSQSLHVVPVSQIQH